MTTKAGRRKAGVNTKPKRTFAERNGTFLTPEEVADDLGVTERMVRRLCHSGALQSSHVGSLLRIHRDDLAAYKQKIRGGNGS